MVSTYSIDCKYIRTALDDVVYLLSDEHRKLINIDNGEAYISSLSAAPYELHCKGVTLTETDSLDERYKFQKTLTFTIDGHIEEDILSDRFYAAVRTVDGDLFIVNVEYPAILQREYTLTPSSEYTTFTYVSKSNHPVLRCGTIEKTRKCDVYFTSCIKSLRLNEFRRTRLNNGTIVYTNDGFKQIDFLPNTFSFTETFNGENTVTTLNFSLPLWSYKSSFPYNMLEFVDNRYVAEIQTCNGWEYAGFTFGLQPSFSIDGADEANAIVNISMTEMSDGNSGEHHFDRRPSFYADTSITYVYTDDYDGYICVAPGVAQYLLQREEDAFGNSNDRYKVFTGYADQFPYLNIIGTFNEVVTYSTDKCGDSDGGSLTGGTLPDDIVIPPGECRSYTFSSVCDWEITNIDSGLTVTPSSGVGNRLYNIEICNSASTSDECTFTYGVVPTMYVTEEYLYDERNNEYYYHWSGSIDVPYAASNCYEIGGSGGGFWDCGQGGDSIHYENNVIHYSVGERLYPDWDNGRCANGLSRRRAEWSSSSSFGVYSDSEHGSYLIARIPYERRLETIVDTYRWVNMDVTTDYECDLNSHTKYYKQKRQVSRDNGATWQDVSPAQYQRGAVYETDSVDCGYGQLYKVSTILSDGTTDSVMCNDDTVLFKEEVINAAGGQANISLITSAEIGSCVRLLNESFSGCTNLTSVTIPNSVSGIGYAAFSYCSSLTSVTIPSSVTAFGALSFCRCSGLTSVAIPNGVTLIGDYAFSYCSSLTSVTIPSSVTSIRDSTFRNCSGLTSVAIPNSVTTIDMDAFKYCSSLTSVTIGNGVTSIGEGAFYGCSRVTSLTIPDSVTTIGDEAFRFWYGISSITIPDSVTSIGDGAFSYCSYVKTVTLTNEVPPEIGANMFEGYDTVVKILVPCESVTTYKTASGWSAYADRIHGYTCGTKLSATFDDGSNASIYCDAATGDVITNDEVHKMKESHYGASITSINIGSCADTIGENAFNLYTELTSVNIPSSVTTIGEGAFKYCSSLTSVTIGNGVTSIGDKAFYYCSGLTSVNIPNSVTSIGNDAFWNCERLTSVTVPDSVLTLGGGAFEDCDNLKSARIGSGVTSLADRLFAYCCSLTSVTIPSSVTSIGNGAFINCCLLPSVTIPDNVTSIGSLAFSNCQNLRSIVIPNGVQTIETATFQSCIALTSVTIGSGVTSIEHSAFLNCRSLSSIAIPNSVVTLGVQAFYGCSGLTSVTIPSSVTTIGKSAFDNCRSLPSITIPNSVTSIGEQAFEGCYALTNITVGNGVTSIGRIAFQYCTGLTSVTVMATTPPALGEYAFDGCYRLSAIYVPAASVDAYKAASGWSTYANIIRAI